MKVFKFGGASIKDVAAIRNMAEIVKKYGESPMVIVVSAMGKTTRNLEAYWEALGKKTNYDIALDKIIDFHIRIIEGLFDGNEKLIHQVRILFEELAYIPMDKANPDKSYDQIISFGEILSSTIISAFLNQIGLTCQLLYAPDLICTDRRYRAGKVSWEETEKRIRMAVGEVDRAKMILTQGFIGGSDNGEIITLGKEGSDYTSAIFASCLDAEEVTIWKDVPGILSADPKVISGAKQIHELPYKEASEMTYYGASVIHPKTIKPLANHHIPLVVRSFDDPDREATLISTHEDVELAPSFIIKRNQCLFTFRVRDYTFVEHENLARIFTVLHELDISINLLQSSAITISVCFDYHTEKINSLIDALSGQFSLHYNTSLTLLTIKNYDKESLVRYRPEPDSVIIQQITRANSRYLVDRVPHFIG